MSMADNPNQGHTWRVAGAGFIVLALNSALAIYRARGNRISTFFVAGSYTTLLLLFACLRAYERAPPGSPAREQARRAVWPLTTVLTVALGVVNSEMALAAHRDRGGLGSATLVLAAYGTLLAAIGLLFREFARGVTGKDEVLPV